MDKDKEKPNKILYILTGIFFGFLIFELILQVLGYNYSPLKIEMLGKEIVSFCKTDWRQYHESEDNYFTCDPILIWRARKNYKVFNRQGLRGVEFNVPKHKEDYYIVAIGDSNTLGPVNSPGWVEYFGKAVHDKNPRAFVINAGVHGYSSFQGLMSLKEVLHYKPDAVLISFGANDAHMVTIPDNEYVFTKKLIIPVLRNLKIMQLFFALSDKLLVRNNSKGSLVPRVSTKQFEKYLNEMVDLAEKNKVKVIFLTRPFVGDSPNKLWWKNFVPQYNRLTKQIAKERGILVIDIFSHFKDKPDKFRDESHFNDAGYLEAAKLIYDNSEEYLWAINNQKDKL